ncbi:transcription factor SPT20 homolog [Bolinopsis microptera]|uniref:transcription factor SPT20 homolog n=1 Tax=Bolinopsis microptera TaxID=2820187 RepID=UPI0030791614
MSVSATQPRRPADDFLASLQSNLQGNARTRRRRGQQQAGNTNAVQKSNVAPKVQSRARPPPVQKTRHHRVKPEPVVGERNKGPKRSTNPPKAAKSNSPKQQQSRNEPKTVPPSNVQVYSSQPPQPEAPIQHQAPPVEVVQTQPVPTYQYPVAAPPEDPVQQQQNVRASQNNFYMKNQSNIFNTGYVDPYQAKRTQQQAMRSTVADRVVVDNALRIASQQPLPPTPSFSAQRVYNVRPEESNQQSFVPHQTGMVMQQNGLIAAQSGNVGVVPNGQPHLNQQVVGSQQVMEPTPAVNEAKPMNSHYHQSFSITGGEPQDNRSAQEVARQKWVQELEAQVREKKQRDQQDKMLRHKSPYPASIPTGVRSTVPNYQPAPAYNNPAAMNLQQVPPNIAQQPNNYPPNIPQQPPNIPVYTQQSPNVTMQPPQVQHLASRTPARQTSESPTQGRMLGQGAWVDPEELERRTDARKRARENQEMIRQQVEERERLKKEEKDKIKREEELQMKRIEEEKRLMAEEVRLEQEKRRQKEAAQLQQIQEMRQKIEEANKKAKGGEAKQEKQVSFRK